jgi:hypothetical protein
MSTLAPKGVSVFGANQVPAAVGSNAPAIPASAYNASYLKPDPRTIRKAPMPVAGGFKSVVGPFSGSDAAQTGFGRDVAPSAYNANYLKSGNRLRYPQITPPRTNQQACKEAFQNFSETPKDSEFEKLPPRHWSPLDVIEILKLLAKGDITDEELETYTEDANRMRAYAAVAKQRALTDEEQQRVDEVGRRLSLEAKKLVAEDVSLDQAKRDEIEKLGPVEQQLSASRRAAVESAQVQELKRATAEHDAKIEEGNAAKYQRQSLQLDPLIRAFEEEERNDYPSKKTNIDKNSRAAVVDKELARLRGEKQQLDDAAQQAIMNQAVLVQGAADAEAERNKNVLAVQDLERELGEVELAKSKRPINPRFRSQGAREGLLDQAQLIASAMALSKAPAAEENKQADQEFASKTGPRGPVADFIRFNLSKATVDKKFFSTAKLNTEWAEYARQHPKVVPAAPWTFDKNRQAVLRTVFESSKVPSVFKLMLLQKAGF